MWNPSKDAMSTAGSYATAVCDSQQFRGTNRDKIKWLMEGLQFVLMLLNLSAAFDAIDNHILLQSLGSLFGTVVGLS